MFYPTVEWMSKKYNELNNDLFDNELKGCEFEVFYTGLGANGNFIGFFTFNGVHLFYNEYDRLLYKKVGRKKIYVNRDNFVELCRPVIQFNGHYQATEDAWVNTLIHEMCHYCDAMDGYVQKQAHGPSWKDICRKIEYKTNGKYTISTLINTDEMKDFILDEKIKNRNETRINNKISRMSVYISFLTDNSIIFTTTSNKKLKECILNYGKTDCAEIIESDDNTLIRSLYDHGYKTDFRTYKYYKLINDDEVDKIIRDRQYKYDVLFKLKDN